MGVPSRAAIAKIGGIGKLATTFSIRRAIPTCVCLALLAAGLAGCKVPTVQCGRGSVASAIEERTCHSLGPAPDPCEIILPEGVDCDDGIAEDEAVALALWNNASFQALLADLGIARADLVEANQLTNPEFSALFPVGVKQFESALTVPFEAIWLRPFRVAIAEAESERIANRLVQDGLNLIRDVRVAYADLMLAGDRLRISRESARLRGRIRDLAEARLAAGDVSGLDVTTAQIETLLAEQQAAALVHEVELAQHRLELLLGAPSGELALEPLDRPEIPADPGQDVEDLLSEALAARPDVCAANLALESAARRAQLARRSVLRVAGILPDINGRGKKGFEAGPGVNFTVPLFHQNQGAIARAEAEVQRARRQYQALREATTTEVRQAHTRLVQAREKRQNWVDDILPAVEDAVDKSEKAFLGGDTSYLLVLETTRQLRTAQLQRAEAVAELHRAAAELERSVGRRLFHTPDTAPDPEEILP